MPDCFYQKISFLEVMRCWGDLRYLGAKKADEINVLCPDEGVMLKVKGEKVMNEPPETIKHR
jgi:hypothetical protein